MSVQKQRTEVGFFPAIKSQQTSVTFVKTSIAATVSTILYLRNVLPGECFDEKKWKNEKLKILNKGTPDSKRIIKWLSGVFDALERKYLRELHLAFYSDAANPDVVLENYTFTIQYGDDANEPTVTLTDGFASKVTDVAHSNVQAMLRKITFLLLRLDKLPAENLHVTIKLGYYDERTPVDYQPPGFKETRVPDFAFPPTAHPGSINFGPVDSKFHKLGAKCKSICIEKEEVIAPAPVFVAPLPVNRPDQFVVPNTVPVVVGEVVIGNVRSLKENPTQAVQECPTQAMQQYPLIPKKSPSPKKKNPSHKKKSSTEATKVSSKKRKRLAILSDDE